jgi:hypothetical protein
MKYSANSEEFKAYSATVMEYKNKFASLDDKELVMPEGRNTKSLGNFFTDDSEPPHPVERTFTLTYDLSSGIADILAFVDKQLSAIKEQIELEKNNHYTVTCTKYITNSKGRVINPTELFDRWDKAILVYSRYKSITDKDDLKNYLPWFKTQYAFNCKAELQERIDFIKNLVVAANTVDGSFFKQAEKIFSEGKKRKQRIGKRKKQVS